MRDQRVLIRRLGHLSTGTRVTSTSYPPLATVFRASALFSVRNAGSRRIHQPLPSSADQLKGRLACLPRQSSANA